VHHVGEILRAVSSALVLALVPFAVTGCGGGGRQTLIVFADTALTGPFGALGKSFEAAHPGVAVRFDFGGSPALARRIAGGARADVFAAVGAAVMRRSGAPGARVFARDSLQIVVPKGNPAHVTGLGDLAGPGVRVALCAAPAPCESAARTALAAAGVTVTPARREPDAAKAVAEVRRGEADAALVYRTDVVAAGGEVEGVAVPAGVTEDFLIATVPGTTLLALTREFVDLVLSDQGRAVLAGAGFTPVTG